MSEQTVEAKVETAVTQPEVVTQKTEEVDYEAELSKKDAEIAKIREEKDNYRKGLLKAKGKLPDENDNSLNEDEDIEAKIERKVNERFLATKEATALAEKDALVIRLAKTNKELSLALKNRNQVTSPSGQGSNQERGEGKVDTLLSNDQINALKAKGWDDKKIETYKKNLIKVNDMPK